MDTLTDTIHLDQLSGHVHVCTALESALQVVSSMITAANCILSFQHSYQKQRFVYCNVAYYYYLVICVTSCQAITHGEFREMHKRDQIA